MFDIKFITIKIMKILKRQKFLRKLDPLQQETLEEDIHELLEKWSNVTEEIN